MSAGFPSRAQPACPQEPRFTQTAPRVRHVCLSWVLVACARAHVPVRMCPFVHARPRVLVACARRVCSSAVSSGSHRAAWPPPCPLDHVVFFQVRISTVDNFFSIFQATGSLRALERHAEVASCRNSHSLDRPAAAVSRTAGTPGSGRSPHRKRVRPRVRQVPFLELACALCCGRADLP